MPAASFRWLQKALLSRSFPLRPAFLQGPRQSASLLPPVRSRRHVKFVPTLSHHLAPTPAFALGFGNARALAFVAAALQACDRPVAAPRCVCPCLSTASRFCIHPFMAAPQAVARALGRRSDKRHCYQWQQESCQVPVAPSPHLPPLCCLGAPGVTSFLDRPVPTLHVGSETESHFPPSFLSMAQGTRILCSLAQWEAGRPAGVGPGTAASPLSPAAPEPLASLFPSHSHHH